MVRPFFIIFRGADCRYSDQCRLLIVSNVLLKSVMLTLHGIDKLTGLVELRCAQVRVVLSKPGGGRARPEGGREQKGNYLSMRKQGQIIRTP